jgi:hypothetical protein
MRKTMLTATALVGASFLATPAFAGLTITDIQLPYNDTLTITSPVSVTAYVGQQVLTTSIGIIDAWCIDAFHDDSVGIQSTAFAESNILTDGQGHTLSSATMAAISALVYYGDAVLAGTVARPSGVNLDDFSASIQLAIWTDEYTTNFAYGGSSTLTTLVSADMTAAAGYGGGVLALYLNNGTGQGLVTEVPEPITVAIFGTGLLGLGMVRRKTIT